MLKNKVLMPLAVLLFLGPLAGTPVWAIPSHGDYQFTSGLAGTFTVGDTGSGVSGLTAWNFFDGWGVFWSSSNPYQSVLFNSLGIFHSESAVYLDGCINPLFSTCEVSLYWRDNDFDIFHFEGLVGIMEFGLPFEYRMVSGPPVSVPEPSTLVLFGLGLLGLGFSKWRKLN